jgi:hypothetical protein
MVLAAVAILLYVDLRGVPALGQHQADADPASQTDSDGTEALVPA